MNMFEGERVFRHISKLVAAIAATALCLQPAYAQSILRDAETEAFFDEISIRPMLMSS